MQIGKVLFKRLLDVKDERKKKRKKAKKNRDFDVQLSVGKEEYTN